MAPITLTAADSGTRIDVRRGDEITIELDENPTTGARWALDNPDTTLTLLRSDYEAQSSAMGGGGKRRLTFAANQLGTHQIDLKNWQPWEGEGSVNTRFSVVLQVT